jgi:hypothetical protein
VKAVKAETVLRRGPLHRDDTIKYNGSGCIGFEYQQKSWIGSSETVPKNEALIIRRLNSDKNKNTFVYTYISIQGSIISSSPAARSANQMMPTTMLKHADPNSTKNTLLNLESSFLSDLSTNHWHKPP